jgi:hypothetical protein
MKFVKLVNNTQQKIRLTYWKQIMEGLVKNEEILIGRLSLCEIPIDASVDEYKCISEDYSSDLFKFRQNVGRDGKYFWIFDDKIQISIVENTLVIDKV